MKEAYNHICDFGGIPHVADKYLWDKLRDIEKELERDNQQAEETEAKVMKMDSELLELAKTKIGALLDAKGDAIEELKQQVEQQREETQQVQEKVEELEECVWIQEEHYAD